MKTKLREVKKTVTNSDSTGGSTPPIDKVVADGVAEALAQNAVAQPGTVGLTEPQVSILMGLSQAVQQALQVAQQANANLRAAQSNVENYAVQCVAMSGLKPPEDYWVNWDTKRVELRPKLKEQPAPTPPPDSQPQKVN